MVLDRKFIILLLNVVLIMSFCLGWIVTISLGISNEIFTREFIEATHSQPLPYSGNVLFFVIAITLALVIALNIVVFRRCS